MLEHHATELASDEELQCLCEEALSALQKLRVKLPDRFGTAHIIEMWEDIQVAVRPFVIAMVPRIYHDKLIRLARVLEIYRSFVQAVHAMYADESFERRRMDRDALRTRLYFYPATLLMYACTVTALRCFKHQFAIRLLHSKAGLSEAGAEFSLYSIAVGDEEQLPRVLKGTLARWLFRELPSDSDVYGLVEATDALYAVALIGRTWRDNQSREEIEASHKWWLPLDGLPEYSSAEAVEDAICCQPIDAAILDLNSMVGGTRERRTFYQMCQILTKRIQFHRRTVMTRPVRSKL